MRSIGPRNPQPPRPNTPGLALRRIPGGGPSGMRTRSRLAGAVATLLVAVGALALVGHPSGAAAKPAPAEPAADERFALTPTGADPTQPGSRTSFSFPLAPGAQAADRVTLFNYGDHATAFQLYANDALDTAEGQLDLKRSDQQATDAGTWVKLEQAAVVVPPSSAVVVPFVVIVPKGASPGDHAAGILAAVRGSATTATGQRVAVEDRVGVPLYVRVAGPLHPALAVVGIQSHYHRGLAALGGGSLDISYRVENVGNVRLAGHQEVEVDGPFGWVLQRHAQADVPELLPGASVAGHLRLSGVLPAVRITSVVRVHPYSKEGTLHPAPAAASASSSVWAIPWLVVLLVAVVAGWIGLRIRRRRRGRGRGPAGPASAPPPLADDVRPDLAGSHAER